ncbi:hypothetical protein Tco_0397963, partial [Tanacetum coccineum]
VLEIFMQQFWYSIKKVQGTYSYEFLLANKKRVVNADVFRTILDICPRVEGVNFTDVPDDDTTLAFLIKLGYKGPLYKHTNMFVDHMHQPWRTLAAIINKCLSGKTTSNDKLREEIKARKHAIPLIHQGHHQSLPQATQFSFKPQETVDVSEESEPEPEPVKRKTSSKRRVKKKVTLSVDDNIISNDPDTALELGKSISQTEAEEAETARKLNGVPSLTPEEKEAANIMKALKESKKTSKRQLGTGGSNEGTGSILGVPDESTVIYATSSERTGSEQESGHSEEDKLDDEEKDEKEGDADDEDDETKSDEDDIYKYKIRVSKDEDEEMINAEVDDFDKGDEEVTDAAKADAEKTSKVKDDTKKTELPPTSSDTNYDFHLIVGQAHTPATVDTESEPEEAPSETEEFEASKPLDTRITSPYSTAPSDSTIPLSLDHPLAQTSLALTRASFHRKTARMAVRTQPTLSPGMSAQIAEVAALSPSSFRKRGPKDESLDSDTEREGSEDDGPGSEEEEEEAAPKGQQQAVLVVDIAVDETSVEETPTLRPRVYITWVDHVDGTIYTDIQVDVPPARVPVQTPPSLEWSYDSLLVSPSSLVVPTPVASPVTTSAATIAVDEDEFLEVGAQLKLYGSILHDHTQRLDALPPTLFEGYDRDLRELYTRSRDVRDEIFSQHYRLRSLEQEQERATLTFDVIWRPVLALESWAGYHIAMQRELQEIRGRVATLEQERSRREQ